MAGFADKRIRALMNRILAGVEHLLRCDFDQIEDKEQFKLQGEDILLIRNLVLDAGNDTIRSMGGGEADGGRMRFDRPMFPIFKHAVLEFTDADEDGDFDPMITMRGEFGTMHEIRDKIGVGLVYNDNGHTYYTCSGLDDVAYHVIPFLDKARMAKIIVGNGEYADWRARVVSMYRGED